METLNIILNIVILLGLAFIYLFGKKYIPEYVSEKAKNLATKEDISGITDEIESVKSNYAHSLENAKAQLQVQSALKEAFQSKSLNALVAVNDLLVEITLYCWKELAERSPNEHYVWSHVAEDSDNKGFHYFRVAIDKASLVHGLYLTKNATDALSKLSAQIGLLSSMELALMDDDPHPDIVESAESGYNTALKAIEKCRAELISELGIKQ